MGGGGLTNWHILWCLQDVAIFEWSSVTWKYFFVLKLTCLALIAQRKCANETIAT